jgi:hypothetical protein
VGVAIWLETNTLSDGDTPTHHADAAVIELHVPVASAVSFDRKELNAILNLYGRKVAEGEWRDYAIDFMTDMAVFSVFRRTSEMPLYRIVKTPAFARKQGAFSVTTTGGLILKRGTDLARVLQVLDKPLKLVR